MKAVSIVALMSLLLLYATASDAALVFGSISVTGKPLSNARLYLTCSGATFSGGTDIHGSFGIMATKEGRCSLSLNYQGQKLSHTVYSQESPARYDLEVVHGPDGRWKLQRR